MKPKLTEDDFCRASKELKVEIAAIKTVATVESLRAGFDAQGRPTILFERHKFYKYAKNRKEWFRKYPHICNPTPGGYGKTGEQYPKYEFARSLDPFAAMMACSWGAFQEMGFNYDDLGFDSVGQMVAKMQESEAAQLEIFIRSVRAKGLVDELRRKDWTNFAFGYNGPAYRKNNYHVKMRDNYALFSLQEHVCTAHCANLRSEHDVLELDRPAADAAPSVVLPNLQTEVSHPDMSASSSTSYDPAPAMPPDDSRKEENIPPSEPAGDTPEAGPRWHLSIEDLKPFVLKWLGRVWKFNGGVNVAQFSTLTGFGFKLGGDYWWVWMLAALLLVAVTTFIAVTVSIILGIILWVNRNEIRHYKTLIAKSVMDPNSFNIGEIIEKKGEEKTNRNEMFKFLEAARPKGLPNIPSVPEPPPANRLPPHGN